MRKQTLSCIFLFFLLPGLFAAENLIFNGGFELGNAGFQCIKYLRPDTNAGLIYEGAFADSKERMAGEFSLCIPNRFSETVLLMTPELQLRPDTEYTFSVWMKAERENYPVVLSILSASVYDQWDAKQKTFSVGRSWKRYSLNFRTSGKRRSPWYVVGLKSCHGTKEKGAALWLDNMQMGRGEIADWIPSSSIEIASLPEQNYFIGEEGRTNCSIRLTAVNYTGKTQKIPLELSIRTEHRGNSPEAVDGENIERFPLGELSLKPGVTQLPEFQYPAKRFGAYCIQNSVNSIPGSYKGYFAVIGRYVPRPIDLNRDFCVSVNLGAGNIVVPPRWDETRKRGFRAAGGGPDKLYAALAAMGCRLIRDWGYPQSSCHWRLLEPEEGHFDFSVMDWAYEISKKHGMTLLPVLGASDTHNPINGTVGKGTLSGLPDWLLKKSTKIPSPAWLTASGKAQFIPPEEYWRKMIRAAAVHFKGRIRWFEIMNEPNICMDSARYLRFLEIAREEIRENASGTKIVGVCSTGDLGGNLTTFVGKVLSGGGLDDLDVLSFHPYNAPNLSSPVPADRQIAGLRSLIRKYRKQNVPLWNTELYYMRDGGKNWFERAVVFPEDVAKRFLTDLGEGVAQSIPLQFGEMFKSSTPHISTSMYGNNQFIPNANFVVYNALARFFEGAELKKKIRYSNGCICYIYLRNGKLCAALWNYQNNKGISADLRRFQVTDLYGNFFSASKNTPVLSKPYYLFPGKENRKSFETELEQLKFQMTRPLEIAGIGRKMGKSLFLHLFNLSSETQEGMAGYLGRHLCAKHQVPFQIPPGSSTVVKIPLIPSSAENHPQALLVLGERQFSYPLEIVENCRVETKIQMQNAEGKVFLDRNRLRLKLFVRDTTPSGPTGKRKPWQTDSVELFLDMAPFSLDRHHPKNYTSDVFRLFVTPRDPDALHAAGTIRPEECRLNVLNIQDGYSISLEVPVAVEHFLGFELKINDCGNEKKEFSLIGGKNPQSDRTVFGLLEAESN